MKKLICLDFDGVIHAYRHWKGPEIIDGGPVEGVVDWIRIHSAHYNLVVHSSRTSTEGGLLAVTKALVDWGIDAHVTISLEKPPAYLTIDDRSFTFTGKMPSVEVIESFKPWWSRQKPEDRATPADTPVVE